MQFGRVIGGFQALQHRMADLHVLVESARSLSRAAASADAGAIPVLGLRAAAVKVYCSEALMRTAGEMIQLHGAIGITWEHQAHGTSSGPTAPRTCSAARPSTPPPSRPA